MTAQVGDGASTLVAGAVAEARGDGEVTGAAAVPPEGAPRQPEGIGDAGTEADAEETRGLSVAQLARLREVLVTAHPDAVPELIAGGTFEDLLGSVAGARAAFTRARDEAARALAAGVPRGGGTREIDPAVFAGLSPEGKIAVGLARK